MRYQFPGFKSSLFMAVLLFILLASWGAAPQPAGPATPERTLAQVAQERIQVADEACKLANDMYRTGRIQPHVVFEWVRRQAEAHMDAPENKANRVAFLEGYVRRAKENEQMLKKQYEAGVCGQLESLAGQYYRLEAEMWLAKAQEQ